MHRDIKPSNILIHSNNLKSQVSIADLGVAQKMKTKKGLSSFSIGTTGFLAPEVTSGKPFGLKCDVYSLGCLMHWILRGRVYRDEFEPAPADSNPKQACLIQ